MLCRLAQRRPPALPVKPGLIAEQVPPHGNWWRFSLESKRPLSGRPLGTLLANRTMTPGCHGRDFSRRLVMVEHESTGQEVVRAAGRFLGHGIAIVVGLALMVMGL